MNELIKLLSFDKANKNEKNKINNFMKENKI